MTLWRVAYAIVPTAEVGICKEGEIQKDARPASEGQASAVKACCREKEAALRRETRGQTQKDRPHISDSQFKGELRFDRRVVFHFKIRNGDILKRAALFSVQDQDRALALSGF